MPPRLCLLRPDRRCPTPHHHHHHPSPSFLLPLRALILMTGMLIFALLFVARQFTAGALRRRVGEMAINVVNQSFLMSFCAVVTQHGQIPKREARQIYVANHTTVLDIVGASILREHAPVAVCYCMLLLRGTYTLQTSVMLIDAAWCWSYLL